MTDILTKRHDLLLLFEVTNGNPNGDPDAGNMPRQEQNSNRGLVSDVCLKRKVRNYVLEFERAGNGQPRPGYDIFIQPPQAHYLNDAIAEAHTRAEETAKTTGATGRELERASDLQAINFLCERFFDIRTFGAVVATGVMSGSPYGQIRGPVQITFAQSFHPVTPQEIGITRCAVTDPAATKEREMGNKYILSYALYAAKAYISPAFAERTGFTNQDLTVFFQALLNMFEHDRSAARGEMALRGLYDFEHVGTQHENNGEQNRREARLGCAHAHKLFEGIQVKLKDDKKLVPESFADYEVICEWKTEQVSDEMNAKASKELPQGVRLHPLCA